MTGNLSRAHAARVHRDDLVIETGEATLIFGDQLWIETARPIPRHFDLDPSPVGRHRLAAIAVPAVGRSEEHTSELQSLMRISYAVLCLKKKKYRQHT